MQQTAQLILVLYARQRVHKATLVGDGTVASDKHVIGDGLAEDLDLKHICDDFFCFPINVGVHKGDVVVACDDISECG